MRLLRAGKPTPSAQRSGRRTALTAGSGLVAAAAIGAMVLGALGAFNATITQNGTFTSGSIILKESGSSHECFSTNAVNTPFTNGNSASCASIDTFAAPTAQLPGGSTTTQTLTFENVGTTNASSFTIEAGTCAAAGTGSYYGNASSAEFCGKVDVTIGNGASTVCYYPAEAKACPGPSNTYTLTSLHAYTGGTLTIGSGMNAGASAIVVVKTTLDTTATNPFQGQIATQGFTFTITQ